MKEALARLLHVLFWGSFIVGFLIITLMSYVANEPTQYTNQYVGTSYCPDDSGMANPDVYVMKKSTGQYGCMPEGSYTANSDLYVLQKVTGEYRDHKGSYTKSEYSVEGSWFGAVFWAAVGISLAWVTLFLIANLLLYIITGKPYSWVYVFYPIIFTRYIRSARERR